MSWRSLVGGKNRFRGSSTAVRIDETSGVVDPGVDASRHLHGKDKCEKQKQAARFREGARDGSTPETPRFRGGRQFLAPQSASARSNSGTEAFEASSKRGRRKKEK